MKSLMAAAVLFADFLAGVKAPHILAELHKHPHPSMAVPVAVCVVLAGATLWVLTSLMRGSGSSAGPQRPTIYGRPR